MIYTGWLFENAFQYMESKSNEKHKLKQGQREEKLIN